MIGKIASVSIYVEDQDKAVEFWTKKAGFVVRKDMPMGPSMRWIEVSPPNAGETVLVLYPKQAMPNAGELKPSLVFECSDIQGTYASMKSNGVLFEGDVLHIAHSVPAHWPPWYTTVGRRAVAHCTSLGKVLLAARPWPEAQQTVERYGWRPYTPKSIQDPDRLERELTTIRGQGFAIDDEERNLGTACVGAPVRDYTGGVIAALSVSGKTERVTSEFRSQAVPRIREAADRISFRLGHEGTSAYL